MLKRLLKLVLELRLYHHSRYRPYREELECMIKTLEHIIWEIEYKLHPPTLCEVCVTERDDVSLILPRSPLERAICAECLAEITPCHLSEYERKIHEVAFRKRFRY
jgi:hypothetical protein